MKAGRLSLLWQNVFFDIYLTNVNANSQKKKAVETILKKHKKEKKRAYDSSIIHMEHGKFTPLVF